MFRALLVLLIIPTVGYFIAVAILNSIGEGIPLSELIANIKYNCALDNSSACSTLANIILLKDASLISGLVSCATVLFYLLISKFAGTNRKLVSRLFPPLIPLVLLAIAIQTFVQGVIITYGVYIGESFLIGRVHFFLIGMVALGAVIGSVQIVGTIFSLGKKLIHTQKAINILPSDQPNLWSLVKQIAEDIESTPPNNIIVGLEPTFYATAAEVNIGDNSNLKGETLYLSLPLMRLCNLDELKSIIGHELGHFKSNDTLYSTKFTPVYRGLGNSISQLSGSDSGALVLARLPALCVLSSMYDSFAKNVAIISREREFEADAVGVSVSSARDLSYALTKVILFSGMWNDVLIDNIKRLNKGKISANLSLVFKDNAAFNLSNKDISKTKDKILSSSISHPTDSHPLLSQRLENIDFDSDEINLERLLSQGESYLDLFKNIEEIEEKLTTVEHAALISLGIATIPESNENEVGLEAVIYAMAAGMVGADGKIVQEEVAVAEQIGMNLLDSFDRTDFRAYIENLDSIPDVVELAGDLMDLDYDSKNKIITYLEAIAKADGEVDSSESTLIKDLKDLWLKDE